MPGSELRPVAGGEDEAAIIRENDRMDTGFQRTFDHLRATSTIQSDKGRQFERFMNRYLTVNPIHGERFARVWLWSEWAAERSDVDGRETGIDLVAEKSEGGFSAVQFKFHAPNTRMGIGHLDFFASASARDPFLSRMLIDTGIC